MGCVPVAAKYGGHSHAAADGNAIRPEHQIRCFMPFRLVAIYCLCRALAVRQNAVAQQCRWRVSCNRRCECGDMIFLRQVSDRLDEGRAVVCHNLCQTSPSHNTSSNSPVSDGRATFIAEHLEFDIVDYEQRPVRGT